MKLRTRSEQKAFLGGVELCAECIEKYLSAEGKQKLQSLISITRNVIEVAEIEDEEESEGTE